MPAHDERAILITGASTGIGRACALRLARRGFRVYAGVRREADAESLRVEGPELLVPVMLDVTDRESIQAAAALIRAECGGLAGLVNNAGIVAAGPLEFLPEHAFRQQFEVNLFGVFAVTQACMPLIRAGRGRVVHIGSIAGLLAFPLEGAYSISKFAIEGFADAQRRELKPFGIPVVLVDPGPVVTPIWDKSFAFADQLKEEFPDGAKRYEQMISVVMDEVRKAMETAVAPERVAEKVEHALTAKRPRARYFVGHYTRTTAFAARVLPDRLLDWFMTRKMKPIEE